MYVHAFNLGRSRMEFGKWIFIIMLGLHGKRDVS